MLRSVSYTTSFLFVVSLFLHTSIRAQDSRKPPERAEDPFRVHVTIEPEKDVAEQRDALERGREELQKRLGNKKDWFRVVSSADEAEIVVVLVAYSTRAERRVLSIWGVVPPTEGGQPDRTQVVEIHTAHWLRARVALFGAERTVTGTKTTKKAGNPKDAARGLAAELEELCKQEYSYLVGRRRARQGGKPPE